MLPEGVAYSAIAGLSPIAGLTAAIAGGLVYFLIGRSRFAIVSPTSSAAAILAASLASLHPAAGSVESTAAALTVTVGLIFLALAVAQLGSFAGFISRPVLRGFAFGLAVSIIVGQLPHIVGVALPRETVWQTLAELLGHSDEFHWASVLYGVSALAALLFLRRFPAIPGALIVLCSGIASSVLLNLGGLGIATTPPVAFSLHSMAGGIGATAGLSDIARLAAPIALILFAESWGTIRNLALRHGQKVSPDREIAALGLANLAAGLVQGMPVGAGFSAGSANEGAGAKSRMSAAVACCAILAVVALAPGLIARIPSPVLSAVVVAALVHALSLAPLRHLLELRRDFWISITAALGVLLFGVLNGMLLAVVLSVFALLRRLAKPRISQLGQSSPGSHDYVDMAEHTKALAIPGVAIFRPNAPLFFGNAEAVLDEIGRAANRTDAHCVILSLEESDDLDSTAIDALGEFAQSLESEGRSLLLARLHDRARTGLELALSPLAPVGTFSVADAVAQAQTISG
ncbi:hypothetical protein MBESOW_P2345 [Sphingobium xenophagum]|uniref:STAS domain-containing protein n=2 Tax=Sphingobium xenophagum TaxID=121428 RepID=A0A401J3D3_SPHXE|nr:hypothetical protein MBESOW_P2345 [Sphingobium xenophagum]